MRRSMTRTVAPDSRGPERSFASVAVIRVTRADLRTLRRRAATRRIELRGSDAGVAGVPRYSPLGRCRGRSQPSRSGSPATLRLRRRGTRPRPRRPASGLADVCWRRPRRRLVMLAAAASPARRLAVLGDSLAAASPAAGFGRRLRAPAGVAVGRLGRRSSSGVSAAPVIRRNLRPTRRPVEHGHLELVRLRACGACRPRRRPTPSASTASCTASVSDMSVGRAALHERSRCASAWPPIARKPGSSWAWPS